MLKIATAKASERKMAVLAMGMNLTAPAFACVQLIDHYPYAACSPKEVNANPTALLAEMTGMGK